MKAITTKLTTGLSFGLLGLAAGAFLTGCASLPDDGVTAKNRRFDNLRGMRYAEVFLIGGDALTHNLKANVYNTTDLNNSADPRNTCPQALWDKVDPETLKKQHHVLGVYKNGPRGWVMDWIELPVSEKIFNFDGLDTHWFMTVSLPKHLDLKKKGGTAYKPTIGHRDSIMTFEKGKPAFILDDAQGRPWVMQAYSLIVDPNLTYDQLKDLGSKLTLPPGWKYRVQILDRDLTIRPINGRAPIMQDELENTYDLCTSEYGTFQP
jgi:hypothetical protein